MKNIKELMQLHAEIHEKLTDKGFVIHDLYTLNLIFGSIDNLDVSSVKEKITLPDIMSKEYEELINRIYNICTEFYLKSDVDLCMERIVDTIINNYSDILKELKTNSYRKVLADNWHLFCES